MKKKLWSCLNEDSEEMGANKSVHVGRSKLDVGVDFTRRLYNSHMQRLSRGLVSMATGSLGLKQPGLIYYSDLLDMSWHKGLHDSDLLLTYRYHRPRDIGPPSLTIKHSVSPEVRIHGIPTNNFRHSQSQGVRLSKLSIGFDYVDPSESGSTKGKATCVYFKRFHFSHDGGRSISTDRDGFQLTRSGTPSDNVIVVSQESRFEDEKDNGFTNFSVQMELGTAISQNLLTYYRFEVTAARGIKLGPALFFSRMSSGTVKGSFAPYQAFAVGGPSSVRGYGEGAIGVGQSCLLSTTELSIPLSKKLTGVIFLDCGSDLWSGDKVPNNPGERHGKPGFGFGIGGGMRFKTPLAQIHVDYAINAFQKGTAYFGIRDLLL
ncbi:outer envelope protein 80, chloroplastic-like isoform X3 [Vigna unguiculata]|uniref:outer envelope protein 80, chloroplastic-like isoform X3 n=1 Tax=Vigna unguiculata TaxID=3917 RepID=UPI00101709BD|nr:outer envelope protein 80, chloroplastic-like isoform X3 [Vigna unguiculata]